MKKSVDILGLPIISIIEGRELGTSKSLVINPMQGAVAAIVVEDGKSWYLGAKLLPFSSISGLGENALIVEGSNNILPIANAPDLEELLAADVKVIGAKVVTRTGRIEGKVTEISIDDSGKIVSCELERISGEVSQLPARQVLTYGKDVLIIADGDTPVSAPAYVAPTVAPQAAPVAQTPAQATPTTPPAKAPAEEATDDSSKKFDDKQRKYLLGKKATKKIESDSGVVIVDSGSEITEEVIQKAKLAGKFVELSMNI